MDKINIELSKEEALVLFEFLNKLSNGQTVVQYEDKSEEQVLAIIECILEKSLDEPFSKNYLELLQKAREKIKNKEQ